MRPVANKIAGFGHMNAFGYPAKHWSLCFTMFSSGIW